MVSNTQQIRYFSRKRIILSVIYNRLSLRLTEFHECHGRGPGNAPDEVALGVPALDGRRPVLVQQHAIPLERVHVRHPDRATQLSVINCS